MCGEKNTSDVRKLSEQEAALEKLKTIFGPIHRDATNKEVFKSVLSAALVVVEHDEKTSGNASLKPRLM